MIELSMRTTPDGRRQAFVSTSPAERRKLNRDGWHLIAPARQRRLLPLPLTDPAAAGLWVELDGTWRKVSPDGELDYRTA